MKIGIVGGNSQVATELAFLLDNRGHTVHPIVRNRQGAAFLEYHGFKCQISNVADEQTARATLEGLDIVLIAAYAGIGSRSISDYKQAWQINKKIVKNCVRLSDDDATIIHFSSIAAFGNELYDSFTKGRLDHYAISKRLLEYVTLRTAKKVSKNAYSFRLGHVLGPSQSMMRKLVEPMEENSLLAIATKPDTEANVVHTVTICDAILLCISQNIDSGRYTVVNNPRWSWRKTFDYYKPAGTEIEYSGLPSEKSLFDGAAEVLRSKLANIIIKNRMRLLPFQLVIPDEINKMIVSQYKRKQGIAKVNSEKYLQPNHLYTHEFSYEPAPGPFLPGVSRTQNLLDSEQVIEKKFN